jgi:hypothetical protein
MNIKKYSSIFLAFYAFTVNAMEYEPRRQQDLRKPLILFFENDSSSVIEKIKKDEKVDLLEKAKAMFGDDEQRQQDEKNNSSTAPIDNTKGQSFADILMACDGDQETKRLIIQLLEKANASVENIDTTKRDKFLKIFKEFVLQLDQKLESKELDENSLYFYVMNNTQFMNLYNIILNREVQSKCLTTSNSVKADFPFNVDSKKMKATRGNLATSIDLFNVKENFIKWFDQTCGDAKKSNIGRFETYVSIEKNKPIISVGYRDNHNNRIGVRIFKKADGTYNAYNNKGAEQLPNRGDFLLTTLKEFSEKLRQLNE